MPTEVATISVTTKSLEGSSFRFQNETERKEGIDQAFDYRGDVTLELQDGSSLEVFLFNRDGKQVVFFVKGSDEAKTLSYGEIAGISFSGKDTAFGKSWESWVSKKKTERQAEAERVKAELEKMGHL
jgi:hypothetical protein